MAKEPTAVADDKLGSFDGVFPAPDAAPAVPDATGQQPLTGTDPPTPAEPQVTAEPQVVVDPQVPVEQPAPAEPTLMDRIREFGIEADDEQAALATMFEQFQQTREYMTASQQTAQQQLDESRRQNAALTEAIRASAQHPSAPAAPASVPDSQWQSVKPLQISDAVIRTFRDTATGAWRDNTPAEVIQEAERYQGELSNFFDALATNPEEVLRAGIESVVKDVVSQAFGADIGDLSAKYDPRLAREEDEVQDAWTRIQPVLFQTNPVTGLLDSNVTTQVGTEFFNAMRQADSQLRHTFGLGPNDEVPNHGAFRMAMTMMGDRLNPQVAGGNGQPATAPAPGVANPQDVREQMRQQQIHRQQRAAGVAPAGGTTQSGNVGQPAPAVRKQNPMLGIGDDFAKSLYGENPGFNMGNLGK